MRARAVLPQIQCLPSAEREPPCADRNDFRRLGKGGTRVRRHVVWTFVVVLPGARLRRQIRDERGEIAEHSRVGIFLDHEASRGVLHEDRAQAGRDPTARDDRAHLRGYVGQTRAARSNLEGFLVECHGLWYAIISRFAPDPLGAR
jgi:hypothetical protein